MSRRIWGSSSAMSTRRRGRGGASGSGSGRRSPAATVAAIAAPGRSTSSLDSLAQNADHFLEARWCRPTPAPARSPTECTFRRRRAAAVSASGIAPASIRRDTDSSTGMTSRIATRPR